MSKVTTDYKPTVSGKKSESLDPAEKMSYPQSKKRSSRKRRACQTPKVVDPSDDLSTPDDDSSEVQELAQTDIDDFGSGLIQYIRDWKKDILNRKMTHLDIVRKYIVWSKTPLSLFQEINLQSLFVYMDAYHPCIIETSQPLPLLNPSVEARNPTVYATNPTVYATNPTLEARNPGSVNFGNPNCLSSNNLPVGGVLRGNATEYYQQELNNGSIMHALLNSGLLNVGGSNLPNRDVNTPNHTIPLLRSGTDTYCAGGSLDVYGRSFQHLNPPNYTASNSNLHDFNQSNYTIPVANPIVQKLGFPTSTSQAPGLTASKLGPTGH
jgi:hypothetical protein